MCLYHLTSAASILGIGLAGSSSAIFAWLVFGAVFGAIGGAQVYAIAQIYAGPRASGTWVGVMNGVGNTSGIVGPILTGLLIEQTGSYMAAFIVSSAIVACGAIWWVVALPKMQEIALD
jgi:nitrate/nitrite transporter NarK